MEIDKLQSPTFPVDSLFVLYENKWYIDNTGRIS